jgi:hypothetical protein
MCKCKKRWLRLRFASVGGVAALLLWLALLNAGVILVRASAPEIMQNRQQRIVGSERVALQPTAVGPITESPSPTDTPAPSPTHTPMPPPLDAEASSLPPTVAPVSPSPDGDDGKIFVILGTVGFVGLAGLIVIALLWRRSRSPAPSSVPEEPSISGQPAGSYLQSLGTTGGPRKFQLTQPDTLVGRAEHAGVRIDESFYNWETVSREHAWIRRQGDRIIIEDNDSTNGVYVNGRRTRRNLLKDGWRLEIGGVAFNFYAGTDKAEPGQRPARSVGRNVP